MESIKRLHENENAKTEAMIYDAGKFTNSVGIQAFYLIMEKMKPVMDLGSAYQQKITNIISYIASSIMINISFWEDIKQNLTKVDLSKAKPEMERLANHAKVKYAKPIKELTDAFNLRNSWVESLVEEIVVKFLTSRGDLHLGNIGLTAYNEFRYFDPTHSLWMNKLNFNFGSDMLDDNIEFDLVDNDKKTV